MTHILILRINFETLWLNKVKLKTDPKSAVCLCKFFLLHCVSIDVIPPFHWLMLLRRSWRLWRFSKKAWSAVEAPQNVTFCGSRQYTTLFARWYHAHEDFAVLILRTPTLRFYCVCIALSIRSSRLTCAQSTTKACLLRSLYDWSVFPTLVTRSWRSAL